MILLAIVLVLFGLRWLDFSRADYDATRSYIAALRRVFRADTLWRNPAAPWLAAVVPAAMVAALDRRLPWYLQLLLAVLVLWYTLGPRELASDLGAWLAARKRGDEAESAQRARAIWGEGKAQDLGALFVVSHERLFGVLLWFFALGPAGALLYRLGRRLPAVWPVESPHPRVLHAALAWAPARLTAMLFAMAGSADDVLGEWRRSHAAASWIDRTWAWLSQIAAASINVEESDGGSVAPANLDAAAGEFLQLEFRSLLILLALFAIFTAGSLF